MSLVGLKHSLGRLFRNEVANYVSCILNHLEILAKEKNIAVYLLKENVKKGKKSEKRIGVQESKPI